jgi:putative ABC transport system permease protein
MLPFLSDARQSIRLLARRPAFTLTAMGTLALGIGATTAIFSAVHHVLIAPLPFPGSERMGYVWMTSSSTGFMLSPSRPVADAWHERATLFDGLALFETAEFVLSSDQAPEIVRGGVFSADLFALLGVRPLAGRLFTAQEARADAAVALITERFWRTRFGRARMALGAALRVDGRDRTIIGVVPDRLAAIESSDARGDIWLPLAPNIAPDQNISVIARLRPNVSAEQASAQLASIAAGVPRTGDDDPRQWRPRIFMVEETVDEPIRVALPVLFAAVGFVLLIACANIAGLLFVQVAARQRELAIRAALGASRVRILRHLAFEVAIIALGGGALGMVVATWSMELVRRLKPDNLAALEALALDPPALVFAAAITLVTAVLFSAAPALAALRTQIHALLASGRGSGGRATGSRFRSTLVVAEVALSLVLLVGATLLIRSVIELQRRAVGFQPTGLLTFRLQLSGPRYQAPEARVAFRRTLLEEVRAQPGVVSASYGTGVPPSPGMMGGKLEIEGRTLPEAEQVGTIVGTYVGPDYFRVLGIPIVGGRAFTHTAQDSNTIVISQAMARRYWPGQDPVGSRLRMQPRAPFRTVVGVAGDVAVFGPHTTEGTPAMYVPLLFSFGAERLIVRAQGDPLRLVSSLRNVITRLDPQLPLRDIETISHQLQRSFARDRFAMTLLVAFALLALFLSGLGLYGVLSTMVAQRTREIAIRSALGAPQRAIRALVLGNGARLTVIGMAIGLAAAWASMRFLAGLLSGVAPRDPLSFGTATVVVSAAALLALYLPLRRALIIDPAIALKAE